jgi:hypothetical protein
VPSPIWPNAFSPQQCTWPAVESTHARLRSINKVAAFQLHQATERYYNTVQLCFTAYKPKLHNIEELGRRVVNLHPGFAGVFPREAPADDALFKQLKNAYVDARYSRTYDITHDELEVLRTRVLDLRERADRYGKEQLELPPSPVREPPRPGLALGRAEGLRERRGYVG